MIERRRRGHPAKRDVLARVNRMGAFDGAQPDFRALGRQTSERIETALERGRRAQDYRASLASAASRRQRMRGEPIVCPGCGTELDVDQPVHSPRCKREATQSTEGKAL